MADYLQELRAYINLTDTRYQQDEAPEDPFVAENHAIDIASDDDSIIESLELLRFKLLNVRLTEGTSDYALGYEEACIKVVEMIDGILHSHRSP